MLPTACARQALGKRKARVPKASPTAEENKVAVRMRGGVHGVLGGGGDSGSTKEQNVPSRGINKMALGAQR